MFRIWMEDLRFIIGLFFGVVSVMLVLAGVISPPPSHSDFNLNLIAAAYIGCFAIAMLASGIYFSKRSKR